MADPGACRELAKGFAIAVAGVSGMGLAPNIVAFLPKSGGIYLKAGCGWGAGRAVAGDRDQNDPTGSLSNRFIVTKREKTGPRTLPIACDDDAR
jgi:hypothetical protein